MDGCEKRKVRASENSSFDKVSNMTEVSLTTSEKIIHINFFEARSFVFELQICDQKLCQATPKYPETRFHREDRSRNSANRERERSMY